MATGFKKVRRVEGHDCTLPLEEDLIALYIDGGLFVDFRRRFRKYLMVSPQNPETKSVLKSTAQIRLEEIRHLKKYYHMIHPFSGARITWEMIMIVVLTGLLIIMPLEFGTNTYYMIIYVKFALDIFSFFDIGLFFCTGYFDEDLHKVIMNARKVFKNYFFGRFFFDVISSLPYNMYITMAQAPHLRNLKYLYLFKLTRVPTLIWYIKKFCIRMDLYSHKLMFMGFVLWVFTLIWWGSAVTLMMYVSIVGDEDYVESFDRVIEVCYEVVKAFMLVAISDVQTDKTISVLFNLACIIIGFVLSLIILAQVMQVYSRHSSARNKYDNLILEVEEYMNHKELPGMLKKKVVNYLEFKFQKNIFKEADILSTLSTILKHDILLHNCQKMIEKVDFFKGLPTSLILHFVTKLKSEIYLPNDVIVEAGITGNAMYFIYVGSVAVYTSTEKEVCHLDDGSYFGEIALIINEPRVATVVAITNCELFKLNRRDFSEALKPYPNLRVRIREAALARLSDTKQVEEEEKTRRRKDPLRKVQYN